MACAFGILLIPLAGAGLALINTGLVRSRNAAHSMLAALCATAVAALAYFICGFAWQGWAGGPAHIFTLAGRPWNWLAAQPFFLRGLPFEGSSAPLVAWFGLLSAGLAALIPLGAGGERWRLGGIALSTALLAGWTYPLFAHWVWGGGWLAGHGLVDAGGSGAIQAVGGLTALSVTWILGPRRGKYALDGMPAAIPGHNAVLVLGGCLLAWVGWLGLNGSGAMLFAGAALERAALAAINTTLAACAALLAAATVTRVRFGKPDASLCANGWVGGLAASSAGCAAVAPAEAVIIGLVAGAVVPFSIEWLELHLALDDPGGAVSVHAVAGLWGVLAAGLFGSGQLLMQVVGIATLLGCVLPLTYGLNWCADRVRPFRASKEGERQGMDLHELGAGAYPEAEDFLQR